MTVSYYFSISTVLLVLDQVTKNRMSDLLPLCVPGYCQSIEILPVFKLTVYTTPVQRSVSWPTRVAGKEFSWWLSLWD